MNLMQATKQTPAITVMTKFKLPTAFSNNHEKFIDYISRKDTTSKKNNYDNYHDYMSNEEKTNALFSKHQDKLSVTEKEKYKQIFSLSQKKGSILFQDVISFDNAFLKEIGILKNDFVDDIKLKEATRLGIQAMLEKENLHDSTEWVAAIHYNTDNIHVHVATVQTHNFRKRGKRKQSSINIIKTKVASALLDRSKENEKINDFIRNKVIQKKKNDDTLSLKNKIVHRDLAKQFKKIHASLPSDKRLWKYNMNALSEQREEIDKFTTMYIEKHFKKEYETFLKDLDKAVEINKRLYGENSNAERYKETKIKDLYSRMGNTLLTETKQYDAALQKKQTTSKLSKRLLENRELHHLFRKIDYEMNNNLQHYKNQQAYEHMQYEKEMER